MRIFTEERIKEYYNQHPNCRVALQDWVIRVKRAEWRNFADIKATFNTADYAGNQHYVFDIKGNDFRLIAIVRFTIKYVYIRFIGTYEEYSKIKDIKTI